MARFEGAGGAGRRRPWFRVAEPMVGGRTPSEWSALERAPRKRGVGLADIAGKVWNAPNTALGLGYGLAGHLAGEAYRLLPGDQPDPRIRFGHNAVEFIDNPAGGASAITIGNASIYNGDPYNPNDEGWYPNGEDPRTAENGHSKMDHERGHTFQGEQLGPLYLPSNVLGGLNALMHGEGWHGDHNWNERGPLESGKAWGPKRERK